MLPIVTCTRFPFSLIFSYLELYSDQYQEGFFYKTIISQMYKMTNQEIDSFLVHLLSLIDVFFALFYSMYSRVNLRINSNA